jgi:hypothetical protein
MVTIVRKTLWVAVLLAVGTLVVAFPCLSFGGFYLSSDIPIWVGDSYFEERDVLEYGPAGFSLYLSGAKIGIPLGANLDAFAFFKDSIIFCLDIPGVFEGENYTEADIIRYNGIGFSKLVDGRAIGIPEGTGFDGVAMLPDGSIAFSIDTPASLGGTAYKANDIIRYDGSRFSLIFEGSANGIPEHANIDGVWVTARKDLFFSLDIPCMLSELEVTDKDIIQWSDGVLSKYFKGASAGLPEESDLDAFSVSIETCPGDSDYDGDVDGEDLATIIADYGRTDCPCEGDLNEDGVVNESDLALFATEYGRQDCLP